LTIGINSGTIITRVSTVDSIIQKMAGNPNDVKFSDLCRVCEHYFGEGRQGSSSHIIYKTPWIGDPRINIQDDKGKAKAYQVRQVLRAIEKLGVQDEIKND
jgi:hypothetical protein